MVKFYALSLQARLLMCLEDIKYFNSISEKKNYLEKIKFLSGLKVSNDVPLINLRREKQ